MAHTGSHWRLDRPLLAATLPELPPQPFSVRTFLPDGYEPNYAYPLLVLFHPKGSNEEQALRLVPRISRRNFVAISIRGPELLGVREDGELACGWGNSDTADLVTTHILRAIEQTQKHVHIHTQRVYLVGLCEGATAAYRTGFALAEHIGGIASLNGAIPQAPAGCPLFHFESMRHLRVMQAHGIANVVVPCSTAARDQKLLYAAGADVEFDTYPTTHRIHEHMLRDLNRWIIGHLNAETDELVRVK